MKRSGPPKRNLDKARAFERRGRESSARSLQASARKSARRRADDRKLTADERDRFEANWATRLSMAGGLCELGFLKVCLGRHGDTVYPVGPHHVHPQRCCRDDSVENLRVACWPCNVQVESLGETTAEQLGFYSSVPLGKDHDTCPRLSSSSSSPSSQQEADGS